MTAVQEDEVTSADWSPSPYERVQVVVGQGLPGAERLVTGEFRRVADDGCYEVIMPGESGTTHLAKSAVQPLLEPTREDVERSLQADIEQLRTEVARIDAESQTTVRDLDATREQLRTMTEMRQRALNDLAAFKEQVRDRMIEEATRRGWCEDFDGILEEFGLDPRVRSFEVSIEVSYQTTVNVEASSMEHAIDIVNENPAGWISAPDMRDNANYDVEVPE